jgi:response regulator RpfG family c-di-GMP phosphodiesterase
MNGRNRVLVVDDELGPREALRMILKDHYEVSLAEDGNSALGLIARERYDVVILDIKMPDRDGIEVLKIAKEMNPDVEVVMITAYATVNTAREAIRHGALDYLIKPFDKKDVEKVVEKGIAKRMERQLSRERMEELQLATRSLSRQVDKAKTDIQRHYDGTVKALIAAIDAVDHYTRGHSERVSNFSALLAQEVGFPSHQIVLLQQAAIVHDIGKIGVESRILRKQGSLTREELDELKRHPQIGVEIVGPVPFMAEVLPVILHHHERYDGKGFPHGLRGEEIVLGARIVAVADAVDAMLSDRPYRKALTLQEVRLELEREAGTQFDPQISSALISSEFFRRIAEQMA